METVHLQAVAPSLVEVTFFSVKVSTSRYNTMTSRGVRTFTQMTSTSTEEENSVLNFFPNYKQFIMFNYDNIILYNYLHLVNN